MTRGGRWLGCAALLAASAAGARADEVDRYLEAQLRRLHVPGASLAIVRNGRTVKARGYGLASLELNAPATAATVYELGSNTKPFTAAAILMLAEEGRLRLDDPVSKFFSEAPAAWRGITLGHLLTHTSGIQNHVAVDGYMDVFRTDLSFRTTPAVDELVRMFFRLPLEFQPGETWAYDNTGYYLLGLVVEKASGRSYWQFLEERVFLPLGLSATRSSEQRPLVPNRAAGYARAGSGFENRPALPAAVPFSAGGLLSTVEDMARWQAALDGDRLLSRASRERMWTATRTSEGAPLPFGYGLGWFVDVVGGHRLAQHGGGTPGFSSVVYRFRDEGLTVVILANRGDRILDTLAIDVAGLWEPSLKRPEAAPDPDPQASRMLRQALLDLLGGRHDDARFSRPMQVFLRTATGRGLWDWVASHGGLESFVFSGREPAGEGRVLRYGVVLGGTRYWFSFELGSDGRIARVCWW
jgi:CubicO group peptidase (beta-lactamase class C family)